MRERHVHLLSCLLSLLVWTTTRALVGFGALHVRILLDGIDRQMRVVRSFHMTVILPSALSFELDLSSSIAFPRSQRRLVTRERSVFADFTRDSHLFQIESFRLIVSLESFFIIQFGISP